MSPRWRGEPLVTENGRGVPPTWVTPSPNQGVLTMRRRLTFAVITVAAVLGPVAPALAGNGTMG